MYHIDSKVDKPDIEHLENAVKHMMERGISVGELPQMYNKFEIQRDGLAAEIQNNYGIQNPNSSKQVVSFLESLESAEVYQECFIDNKWTTKKNVLKNLASLGYQFATDILDYRKVKKYAESIKSMQDAVGADHRVHPIVSLTKTNRISYSEPALMNIPKPLLWHIIKPNSAGNVLISADIKNQEPSILINILNATHLKEALVNDKGMYEGLFEQTFNTKAKLNILVTSAHKQGYISNEELSEMGFVPPVYYTPSIPATASSYYNGVKILAIDVTNVVAHVDATVPTLPDEVTIETIDGNQHKVKVVWEDYDKRQLKSPGIISITGIVQGVEIRCEGVIRSEFKTAWNAMTYGASLFGIVQMCKHIGGEELYKFFNKIDEFKTYKNACKKLASIGRQTIQTYFGTILHAGVSDQSRLKRVLMDLPIQGTASDILSMLIIHCEKEIVKRGLVGKLEIYYTRHDEIIFEANIDWVNEVGLDSVIEIIKDLAEHQVDNWIPFRVEVKQVESDKLYIDDDEDEEESLFV